MEIRIEDFCQNMESLFHVRIRAVERKNADQLYPEPESLFFPEQFLSVSEMHHLIQQASPQTPYRLTDHCGAIWLFFSIGSYYMLCGPMLCEILTRLESNTIFRHNFLPSSARKPRFFYEGEDQMQRCLREYLMSLPLINRSNLQQILLFIFKTTGKCSPMPEKTIDLLGFNPCLCKKESVSKYIAYQEDCEAGLTASVAHSSFPDACEIVNSLYKQCENENTEYWNHSLFRFASIATLARNGARRAGVPAAASAKVLDHYTNKAFQADQPCMLKEISIELVEALCSLVNTCSKHHYSPIVCTIIDKIKTDFSSKLSLSTLADEFGLNASYLATIFKKDTGMTINAYINQVRLEYARTMLTVSNLDIGDICARSGIPDQCYFSRLFREKYGVSPSQYRINLFANTKKSQNKSETN